MHSRHEALGWWATNVILAVAIAGCGGGASRSPETSAIAVDHNYNTLCLVTKDGKVRCVKWDVAAAGEMREVAGISDAVEVAVTSEQAVARTKGGVVYRWALGKDEDAVAKPVEVAALKGATALATGDGLNVWAVMPDGSLLIYFPRADGADPLKLPAGFKASKLRLNNDKACVGNAAGEIACTASSVYDGEFFKGWPPGHDNSTLYSIPGITGARDFAGSQEGVCAIVGDATVACFGFGLGEAPVRVEVPGVTRLETRYANGSIAVRGGIIAVQGAFRHSTLEASDGKLVAKVGIGAQTKRKGRCDRHPTLGGVAGWGGCYICASGAVQCGKDGFPLGKDASVDEGEAGP